MRQPRASQPAASEAAADAISGAALPAQFGADPADIELVGTTVTQAGAQVIQRDPASWRVRISGTAAILEALLGTTQQVAGITDPTATLWTCVIAPATSAFPPDLLKS